jgi:hypothetical protein
VNRALAIAAIVLAWAPRADAQTCSFPTTNADYPNFYPTSYFDHGGLEDWNCGSFTYTNHRGSDYGVGGWAGMEAGMDVTAAADGTVVAMHDGEPDTCSTGDCGGGSGFGNYVKLRHPDGKYTIYGHMVTWSIPVDVGDTVACGDPIGLVGSSGNSTGPHIHFEVRTPGDTAIDSFNGPCSSVASSWTDQGDYMGVPVIFCDDTPPPRCSFGGPAPCGETVHADLTAGGSSDEAVFYSCTDFTYEGPEYAWRLTAAATESVTIDVTGLTTDLDLMILEGDTCDPLSCMEVSDTSDLADESVTFDVVEGETYAIVVDGWEGRTGPFDISFTCTEPERPDLSLYAEILPIDGQDPDFVPTGASAGVFDVFEGQVATVHLTYSNASATARNVAVGVTAALPHLGISSWDLVADDGTCGDEWCPDPATDMPGQPPRTDPGPDLAITLGDVPPDASRRIVLEVTGILATASSPEVRTWISSVEGVYAKEGYDSSPTLNEGQTWNGGELRASVAIDVWDEDTPVDPGTEGEPVAEAGPFSQDAGCGCSLAR